MTHTQPAPLLELSPHDLYENAVAAMFDGRMMRMGAVLMVLLFAFVLVLGVPVATVFCLGLARSYPALARFIYLELAAIVAGLSVTCLVAHRKARQYQQEIDELDALRR